MTQLEQSDPTPNSHSHSQFETTLTLEPPPPPSDMNPTQDPFPVRSPRSRTAITFSRKKRKKTSRNTKAAEKKLDTLRQTLNPIPFVPAKTLDFAAHQDLLRRLGLWDFVNIKFDRTVRADLLAKLIANYNPQLRCSYVDDKRVNLNRTDLGRALTLPVMQKTKKSVAADAGEEEQPPEKVEAVVFVEDLVSSWMLLHEDMWMMPTEVLNYMTAIRGGQFGKVDWAGLVWYMVSEEIARSPKLENCYYASHLQHLMKSQREELFSVRQEEKVEIDLKDDDEEEEEEEDGGSGGDVKMEDVRGGRLEEMDVKLCLGNDNVAGVEQEIVESGNVGGEAAENVDAGEEKGEEVEAAEGENVEKVEADEEEYAEIAEAAEGENVEKVEADEEEYAEKAEAAEEGNVGKVEGEAENVEKGDAEEENLEKVSCEAERVEVVDEDEDEDVMDFEGSKEGEPAEWELAGKGSLGEPCLQRCNLGGVKDFGCGDERNKDMEVGEGVGEEDQEEDELEDQEEEEDDDQEGGFHLLPKGFSLEGFPSGNLTQGMDGMPMRDHFGLEFPSPRDLMLPGSSSVYGNGPKREINHENDDSHQGLNGNKRLRTDGSWDGKVPGDFEASMDQIQQWMGRMGDMQQWMGKARMLYAEKENECQQASVNQQFFMQELQKRDELIEQLHKARFEDQQKLQTEKFRFEHEIHLMNNLLDGYRKALKATQNAFAEYRARSPQAVEPLYRDVPGSGGLMLSTTELEKLRMKQEEEERMTRVEIETMIQEFDGRWSRHYETHYKQIELTSGRLLDAEKEVKFLKEGLLKKRVPETQESTPNECDQSES
ncbi:uncharacterized protein LOC126798611 [Argentina anserina]|uniref:uncharacterized protein LOC126798611 n=1 Tax=Argentina anserina TaxID=57926 RepID=UPI0021763734|nr:uncharacterized protein LOC126798611 [Potentilla anserina]